MQKKESTPMREIRRKYEENNKEKRKQTNKQFATFIPVADYEEMDTFLKKYRLTKVELIYEGYLSLKQRYEQQESNIKNELKEKE